MLWNVALDQRTGKFQLLDCGSNSIAEVSPHDNNASCICRPALQS